MRLYLYLIFMLLACSHVNASSYMCDAPRELLEKISIENRDKFDVSVRLGYGGEAYGVNFSAPDQIDGVDFKDATVYALNSDESMIFLFTVKLTKKDNRFLGGFAIHEDVIDKTYIELIYDACGMTFTYPLSKLKNDE